MAKKGVSDEYYTPAQTIINELKYYGYDGFFKGKTIYLPCDYDATLPYIKKEIKTITHVEGPMKIEFNDEYEIYKVVPELFTEKEKNNVPRKCQFVAYLTEHKEDFEIKDIYVSGYDPVSDCGMKFQNAPFELFDIIITNPPFSQIEDWINKIVEFEKKGGKFCFLAPLSILTNTFAFPYFKSKTFWCGYTEPNKYEDINGNIIDAYLPTVWLTNFNVNKHKPKRPLSKSWKNHPEEFMPYWNYKAINIDSIDNIPYDYKGVMGVAATFLKDLHSDQFEIVGFGQGKKQFQSLSGWIDRSDWDFKKYLEYADTPRTAHSFDVSSLLILTKDLDHPYKAPFCRVLIKNKELSDDIEYYDYDDVIKWVKKELKAKPADSIWNSRLFKKKSNAKVKHGKGGKK